MELLIELLEQPYNWLYSFFIFISIGIWLVASLGLFHIDTSAEISHDLSTDIHADGFFHSIGEVLGFGMIPTSVLITLVMCVQGISGIALNAWILDMFKADGLAHYIILSVNFFIALFIGFGIAAVMSRPLHYLFKDYGTVAKADSVVGKVAQVSSGKVNMQSGQATLKLEDGNTIEIAVRIQEDQHSLEYGQKLLILEFDKERNVYLVERYD